jgi:hypothetical protein
MRFVIGEYYLGKAIEGMSAFHPLRTLRGTAMLSHGPENFARACRVLARLFRHSGRRL